MPTETKEASTYRGQYLPLLRVMFALILCGAVGFYVHTSIHWKMIGDTSAMHYVNFLIDQGWAPYRDIHDINLPGAYFIEGGAMHVFGGGDLGLRFYDFSLLAILIGSLIIISLPYDWFAGLFAGVIFLLIHGAEGPWNAGQRELLMITLIMISYTLLFTALRRQKPLLALPFGFIIGLAASVKPTAVPLGFVLLVMAAIALRKNNVKATPFLIYGLLGLAFALLINLGYLYKYHAFADFVANWKRITPYYASVGNSPWLELFRWLVHIRYALMLAIGGVLIFLNPKQNDWENWERAAVGLGVLFGASSFLIQRKPWDHHTYSFAVFVLLWFAIEVSKAWKKKGWMHAIGVTGFALGTLVWVPQLVLRVDSTRLRLHYELADILVSDLTRLGGSSLQREVECFDVVDVCPSAFYRLKLLPYSKINGDFMFFPPGSSPPMMYYRDLLWNELQKNPPRIIVLTNEWLAVHTFDKIGKWPEFVNFLNSAYSLTVSRSSNDERAYRIYVLKSKQSSIARVE